MESCYYEGTVVHERARPVAHGFRYRLYLAYLDLDELPGLVRRGLVSDGRFAAASFLRRDHLGDARRPLADCVRELVVERAGFGPGGPVRVLAPLRSFGYYFAPLSLFFCYGADGRTVEAVVAEVRNTPWLERHCYVLWAGNREASAAGLRYRHPKAFHVSPFLGMEAEYHWRIDPPADRVRVEIEHRSDGGRLFRAGLGLKRVAMTRQTGRALAGRYPAQPARITAAIYWQAFLLWRKSCPYYPHPNPPSASGSRPGRVPGGSVRWPVGSGVD